MACFFEVCFIFEFGAAELSLEKFRNAVKLLFCGGRPIIHREQNDRQKDELVKHSC